MFKALCVGAALLCSLQVARADTATPDDLAVYPGEKLDQLKNVLKLTQDLYAFSPIRKNENFQYYVVQYTPETGVCSVVVTSKDYPNDATGVAVRVQFAENILDLNAKFGAPNSLLDRPGEDSAHWTQDLMQNTRLLAARWLSTADHPFPASLSEVQMRAYATTPDTTHILVKYAFKNYDACTHVRPSL